LTASDLLHVVFKQVHYTETMSPMFKSKCIIMLVHSITCVNIPCLFPGKADYKLFAVT